MATSFGGSVKLSGGVRRKRCETCQDSYRENIRLHSSSLPVFLDLQEKRKGPAASYSRAGGSRTTLGDGALDFRVRNGNGYFCLSMATGPEMGWSVGD